MRYLVVASINQCDRDELNIGLAGRELRGKEGQPNCSL
jgi:hypothetical protein